MERRCSLDALLDETGAPAVYVVSRRGERLQGRASRLEVHEGLLHAKVARGAAHPLIRALGPVRTVLDGTLGLLGDALHIAAVTGASVHGAELSPWVAELAEAGLVRLRRSRWGEAAKRITLHRCAAAELAGRLGRVDAVFLAPMFERPAKAAPGFELFRHIADPRPLDVVTYRAARAVAERVVIRVERGSPPPFPGMERIAGKAVDYWIGDGDPAITPV